MEKGKTCNGNVEEALKAHTQINIASTCNFEWGMVE